MFQGKQTVPEPAGSTQHVRQQRKNAHRGTAKADRLQNAGQLQPEQPLLVLGKVFAPHDSNRTMRIREEFLPETFCDSTPSNGTGHCCVFPLALIGSSSHSIIGQRIGLPLGCDGASKLSVSSRNGGGSAVAMGTVPSTMVECRHHSLCPLLCRAFLPFLISLIALLQDPRISISFSDTIYTTKRLTSCFFVFSMDVMRPCPVECCHTSSFIVVSHVITFCSCSCLSPHLSPSKRSPQTTPSFRVVLAAFLSAFLVHACLTS